MSDPQDPRAPRSLKVALDDQTAQGRYANLVMVSHGESEFVLDFMFLQPGRDEARVGARAILGPRQARRLLNALQENIARYEQRFGPVTLVENPGDDDLVH
jgi:hypothetical protein